MFTTLLSIVFNGTSYSTLHSKIDLRNDFNNIFFMCLSFWLSVCLSVRHYFIWLYFHPFCDLLFLSVCLSVCLSLFRFQRLKKQRTTSPLSYRSLPFHWQNFCSWRWLSFLFEIVKYFFPGFSLCFRKKKNKTIRSGRSDAEFRCDIWSKQFFLLIGILF